MTTKKQTKAQERKRREQLERKIALRRERRAKTRRIVGIVLAALVVGALVIWAVVANSSSEGDTPAVSPTPAGTASPGNSADADVDDESDDDIELAEGWGASPAPPNPERAEGRMWTVELDTNQGPIVLELDGQAAPQTVASFVALAQDSFFDQTECHRLVTSGIYVLQCGDPTSSGMGGPVYRYGPIENAPEDDFYPAGTLAMARAGNDGESMGSQFFMVYDDSTIGSDAAGGYTVFGTVAQGLTIVESIAQSGTIEGTTDGRPTLPLIINEVSVS